MLVTQRPPSHMRTRSRTYPLARARTRTRTPGCPPRLCPLLCTRAPRESTPAPPERTVLSALPLAAPCRSALGRVQSGIYFGFLLGLAQAAAWTVAPRAWTLPVRRDALRGHSLTNNLVPSDPF